MGGWWRSALVSPDGVAPSRIVGVSASVNLAFHHKVQKFSSDTGSPGWYRKKGRKTVMVMSVCLPAMLRPQGQHFGLGLVTIGHSLKILVLILDSLSFNHGSWCIIFCTRNKHCFTGQFLITTSNSLFVSLLWTPAWRPSRGPLCFNQ